MKNFTLLSGILLLSATTAFAGIIDDIKEAEDGAIVYVSENELIEGTIKIEKNLTIKADPNIDFVPVLEKVQFSMNGSYSLTIDGIEAYYDGADEAVVDSKYFLTMTTANTHDKIEILNCKLYGYSRGILRSDNGNNIATINNLNIKNCDISEISKGNASYSVLGLKTAKIANATIENTSFYNCPGGIWYSEQKAAPINLTFKNVNILNCTGFTIKDENSTNSSKRTINASANEGSKYLFENCIIDGTYNASTVANINIPSASGEEATEVFVIKNSIINHSVTTAGSFDYITMGLDVDFENMTITPAEEVAAELTGASQFVIVRNGEGTGEGNEDIDTSVESVAVESFSILSNRIVASEISNIEIFNIAGNKVEIGRASCRERVSSPV